MVSEAHLFIRDQLDRLESSLFTVTLDLESIADVVEHNELPNKTLIEFVDRLISWLSVYPDRESLLFTISAFLCKPLDWSNFDFSRIVEIMPEMGVSELHHALFILGSSFNPNYVPILQEYLSHGNPGVRGSAEDALTEISHS
ncbi:MAG: HEAT repeat domain-containing protein [Planctomycetota bacterium]|nr:HEAT repeat domain-containing protein [Planctomycetota bacterium]